MKRYDVSNYPDWYDKVAAGDEIELSGTVYTARDAAHKRIFRLLDEDKPLPFDLKGAFIYYAGPTPAAPEQPIARRGRRHRRAWIYSHRGFFRSAFPAASARASGHRLCATRS